MSVYGVWHAKNRVAVTLRTYLATEVAAINTAAPVPGLALYVPVSGDVVTFSKAGPDQSWPAEHRALFEVLCDSSDVTEWFPAEVPSFLTMSHEIALRISAVDRLDGAIALLYATVELYVAACDRVLALERQALGATDGSIESVIPTTVEYRNTESDKIVRQATRRYTVRTREVNS